MSQYLGPEGSSYRGGFLLHNLLLFGRVCRSLGMKVTPARMTQAARALQSVDLGRKSDFFHALRCLIVSRQSDLAPFQKAFRIFWQQPAQGVSRRDLRSLGERRLKRRPRYLPGPTLSDGPEPDSDSDDDVTFYAPTYSRIEALRRKDFAEMSEDEIQVAKKLMSQFAIAFSQRRSRRRRAGRTGLVDLRQTLRRSLRYGGEALDLPRRLPRLKPRRLVLISDISGSMERYSKILLHFMHVLSARFDRIESFVFGTRLTRITRALRYKSVDRALKEVGFNVRDWGGGTRIGEALKSFNYRFSRRVLGWGAVVLIITDGWDRGEPQLLEREAARLGRSCYRLIWLNPLLGHPGYQPLTRGAEALLPNADDFLPLHNLESLEDLAKPLSDIG